MKNRIIILAAILLFCVCLTPQKSSAQQYRPIEQNMSFESVIMDEIGIGVNYSIGCNIDNVFFAGTGINIGGYVATKQELYENLYCTLYAQLRGKFLPSRSVRPYIEMIAGMDGATLGLYLKPSIGVVLPASSTSDMFIGVGYSINTIEYDWDVSMLKGGIGITLGITF